MAGNQNQAGFKESYGMLWMNTGNWTGEVFTLLTSYSELTGLGTNFTLMSPSNDFAMTTDGRLKYTGIRAKDFILEGYFCTNNTGSIAIALYKNGSLITGGVSYSIASLALYATTPISLATNDYVSLFAKRSAGSGVTVFQASISAKSRGLS